jgi:hypothetical protein
VLWTELWPEGKTWITPDSVAHLDGFMQWPWWRGQQSPGGPLSIEGRRLGAEAPPLQAKIRAGYGSAGFQSSLLRFPTEGCWEITGRVGEASLTFVTLVAEVERWSWLPADR